MVVARLSPEQMQAERLRVRQKSASEVTRRERLRDSTRPRTDDARKEIDAFVKDGMIASYPLVEEDLADEASVPTGKGSPRLWLEAEIVRAFARVGVPAPTTEASTLAQWLLTSHDATFAVDLEHLPKHAATPARVLAHLESLALGLPPRLAVTIARRASLLLMNCDLGGPDGEEGKHDANPSRRGDEATRDAAEAHRHDAGDCESQAPAPRRADADGAQVPPEAPARHDGGSPECVRPSRDDAQGEAREGDDTALRAAAQAELIGVLEARYWWRCEHEERDERARVRARTLLQAASEQRQKERDAEAAAPSPIPKVAEAEAQAPAARQDEPARTDEARRPEVQAPAEVPAAAQEPPPSTDALIAFLSGGPGDVRLPEPRQEGPRMFPQMVIDFTGSRMEVAYRGDPARALAHTALRAARAPTGPKVTGYVEAKEDMVFCAGAGHVTLRTGTVVELLHPSDRDRKDLERFGKEKRPHAMIRWGGLSRCVPSKCLVRSSESAWRAQNPKKDSP